LTYRHTTAVRWLYTAVLAALAVACANRAQRTDPPPCAGFEGAPALDAAAIARLSGDFFLTLVATSGTRSGHTARGTTTLFANPARLRRLAGPGGNPMPGVTVPFYGTADIDVTEVGALPLGTTTSDDPLQPGVLVVQDSPADPTIVRSLVMRLGSDVNRRGAVPFDGGYTVLRVRHASPDSILGSWASGTVTEVAAGFFCAVRLNSS
jgi:hypothetical protein